MHILNILLINPINPSYYYRFGLLFPPLGLGYLTSILKKHGHKVRILDMNIENFDFRHYDYSEYDLIGISSDTVRFPWATLIAKEVKKQNKLILMGGPHPSVDPINIIKSKIADYVVLGEGEETFLKLVDSIDKGELYPKIKGVAYLDNNEEVYISSLTFISDLDSVPFPDWDALYINKYKNKYYGKRAVSIVSSRGCPFDCEFCSVSQLMGRRWRKRSVDNVIEEMKILKYKYGFEFFVFFDDNFTVDPKRVIELSERMLKENLNVEWFAFSRTDEIVGHENMVKAMAKAGCRMLFIGFESASDEAMKEFNKMESVSISYDAVKILKKNNIDIFASFILGALSDNLQSVKKTVKFAKSLKAKIDEFTILTPIPGTRLYKKLESKILTKDYSLYDMTHLVFKHPNFTPEQLRKIFIKAYISVYATPDKLFTMGLPFLRKVLLSNKKYKEIQEQLKYFET